MKFYPYEKEVGIYFSHAKGDTTSFGVVLTQELEVLAILKGRKNCPPCTREGIQSFTLS